MPKRVLRVVKGWVKSLVALVKGIFWIFLHPLTALGRLAQLLFGSLAKLTRPRSMGRFLREAPYEPYKAMTTMAVVGAIGVVGMGLLHNEQGLVVAEIVLMASGIAYVMWRSVEFFHGHEDTADGIDGFILVVEAIPVLGGLAVMARLTRMEAVVARVEGLGARTQAVAARTGKAARTVSSTTKTVDAIKQGARTGKTGVNVVQPTVSVSEWATHWVKMSDEFTRKLLRPLKTVGKRFKR